jgi:hypothetical protein
MKRIFAPQCNACSRIVKSELQLDRAGNCAECRRSVVCSKCGGRLHGSKSRTWPAFQPLCIPCSTGSVRERATSYYGGKVELLDGLHPDCLLDSSGGRWLTVCLEHSTVCNHRTIALARGHLRRVEWCEECRAAQEARRSRK